MHRLPILLLATLLCHCSHAQHAPSSALAPVPKASQPRFKAAQEPVTMSVTYVDVESAIEVTLHNHSDQPQVLMSVFATRRHERLMPHIDLLVTDDTGRACPPTRTLRSRFVDSVKTWTHPPEEALSTVAPGGRLTFRYDVSEYIRTPGVYRVVVRYRMEPAAQPGVAMRYPEEVWRGTLVWRGVLERRSPFAARTSDHVGYIDPSAAFPLQDTSQ